MSNVLILGGSGLVGSNFSKGIKLSSKDVNLLYLKLSDVITIPLSVLTLPPFMPL